MNVYIKFNATYKIYNSFCSDDEQVFLDREVDSENRCYYLTVTTVPSLHDCYDCRMVAASFDEEGKTNLQCNSVQASLYSL